MLPFKKLDPGAVSKAAPTFLSLLAHCPGFLIGPTHLACMVNAVGTQNLVPISPIVIE